MGTRGAVGFKQNDKLYVTYNHFDSYPDGLGKAIIALCKKITKEKGWEVFKHNASIVQLVTEEIPPTKEDIEKYKEFSDLTVSGQSLTEWYCLFRNLQMGELFEAIYHGKVQHMIDNFEFLKDSLFCEYAYIINLDNMTIEFYEGFNTSPQENNPLPIKQEPEKRDDGFAHKDKDGKPYYYYPVRYQGCCPVDKIPINWKSKFFPEKKE